MTTMTGTEQELDTPEAPRIELARVAPGAYRAMMGVEAFAREGGLEGTLLHLVKVRASYMNGCAYCVDMHMKDALAAGETVQRLYGVPVWRESPYYTPRERAALAWTEAVTDLARTGVPEHEFVAVRRHFDEEELVRLTMAIVSINGWNRLAVAFRAPAGSWRTPATAERPAG